MITDKMVNSLNKQMNREYFSSFFYLSMASYAEQIGFKGSAKWFKIQHHEENYHAMKFYEYLQSRGGKIEYLDIEKPEQEFKSMQDLFTKTLKHEENVTKLINNLMDIAVEEKDHASQIFLQWFITEQVEEEENVNDILTQINLIAEDVRGLMNLDKELGQRVLNAPIDFSNGLPKV
ncbi:MAG: ferritin [Spirochaetaceae bacterium]